MGEGAQGRGETWIDDLELHGAEMVASPTITRHRFGSGTAFYLATQPDPKTMWRVLQMALQSAGVQPVADVPPGVEAMRRSVRGKSFLFLLNHREAAVDVPIKEAGTNLLDGAEVHPGLLHLEPRGVAVIREGW
jgi:beta-galactosidase